MPKQSNSERESLPELEKIAKRIIRKSLKDNTLDYTIQYTVSSLEPGKVKYAAQISSPAKGVQPITFIFDSFEDLKKSLMAAESGIDRKQVELTFHESRINSYKSKIQQHEERIAQIEKGEDEEIEMEEV